MSELGKNGVKYGRIWRNGAKYGQSREKKGKKKRNKGELREIGRKE